MACHGHAGEFARTTRSRTSGNVIGARGQVLSTFLTAQKRRAVLSLQEMETVLDTFEAQLQSSGFYQEWCLTCHARAHEYARAKLVMREGNLMGRNPGGDMQSFLVGHAVISQG